MLCIGSVAADAEAAVTANSMHAAIAVRLVFFMFVSFFNELGLGLQN